MRKYLIFVLATSMLLANCKKDEDDNPELIICQYDRSDVEYNFIKEDLISYSHDLDINHDGVVDFILDRWSYWQQSGYSEGAFLELNSTGFSYALNSLDNESFKCGDMLNQQINWCVHDTVFWSDYYNYGDGGGGSNNWTIADGEVGFIGVRYEKENGEIRYGWIKVVDEETRVVEYVVQK